MDADVVYIPGMEIDYEKLTWYIRANPEVLVGYVCEHLPDDDMADLARGLWEYTFCAEWRAS